MELFRVSRKQLCVCLCSCTWAGWLYSLFNYSALNKTALVFSLFHVGMRENDQNSWSHSVLGTTDCDLQRGIKVGLKP